MKSIQEIVDNTNIINEEQIAYDEIIKVLQESKENNIPIDEGVVKALLGGVAGATVGPSIMKGVCKVLGISESGALGNLMTSRLILTALAGYLGWKN
jgi:hypothetical protein